MILAARSASSQLIAWLQKPHSCGGQLITRALAAPTRPGAPPAGCSLVRFFGSMQLPVDDGEHQLQVLCDCVSPGGAPAPRRRDRGTARGRRERHCPFMRLFVSCARKIAS